MDTVSHHVPSGKPVLTTQIIDPHPVNPTTLVPILGAENVTLQWPKPDGRIGKITRSRRLGKVTSPIITDV